MRREWTLVQTFTEKKGNVRPNVTCNKADEYENGGELIPSKIKISTSLAVNGARLRIVYIISGFGKQPHTQARLSLHKIDV